jgi:methionine-rich copper-binding protein CopC
MRLVKFVSGLFLVAIAVSAALSPAFAHAKLVQSNPVRGSASTAPKVIKLTFDEKITPAFSGFKLSMADGMVVSTSTSLSDDGKTLIGRPTSPFMSGKWTLSWHATSVDDGHKTEGTYTFTVK